MLLKGINDDVDVMKRLMHGLLMARVKPYYLYQCDPISGSAHFRTSVEKGLEIIRGLRGHTTGYAVPTYVVDAPAAAARCRSSPIMWSGARATTCCSPTTKAASTATPIPAERSGRAKR